MTNGGVDDKLQICHSELCEESCFLSLPIGGKGRISQRRKILRRAQDDKPVCDEKSHACVYIGGSPAWSPGGQSAVSAAGAEPLPYGGTVGDAAVRSGDCGRHPGPDPGPQ